MKKKIMACLLSISMVASMIPVSGVKADSPKQELLQSDNESTMVYDADDYDAGYLWAHFRAFDGYEKMFFGYSEDGLNWKTLNKDESGTALPVLENNAPGSDGGVRDPHLIRSHDGKKYWILGTDLHAEGGGGGGSGWDQENASQDIVVWESEDLVNWSEPRLVYSGFENAGCVWAPEAIYDKENGDYLVYWSSRDKSLVGTEENALRVYVSRTEDFKTFTEAKVWLSEDEDSGKEVNIIDTTIVEDDGKYYRFSTSDWNTVIDVSDTLDDEDVFDVRADREKSTPNGSWTRLVTRSGSGAAGFDNREGFTVYKLPDNETWCAMGDNGGYQAFLTNDLSSGKFEKADANFMDGGFRHGTVMRLSAEEEEKVLDAYYEEEPEVIGSDEEPVLEYNFEEDLGKKVMTDTGSGDTAAYNGTLYGNAKVVYDEERKSNVLQLDGTNGTYGQFPTGFFDDRNHMVISMDVKTDMGSGNFFTFTYGKSNEYYNFLRVRGKDIRYAMTVSSWRDEKEVKTSNGAGTGKWQNIVFVMNGTKMELYVNGYKVGQNRDTGLFTSDLGSDLLAYLGKSFYGEDAYFKGSFDNIKVYQREMSSLQSAVIGTMVENINNASGLSDHTAITTLLDEEKKEITPYVRKGTDLTAVPVKLSTFEDDVKINVNGTEYENGESLDLSEDIEATFAFSNDKTEKWTIKKPVISNNPVLPGQFADPDIDMFNGKYYIYPTTDGVSDWGGYQFRVFSSTDLINWEDEGIILDLKANASYENHKGVDVGIVPWASGNAWAPTIEERNGKYYFYFSGHYGKGNAKAIGVAVADSPTGPFVAKETPLLTIDECRGGEKNGAKIDMGQVIDPSIYTEEDGTPYMLFGNGNPAIVQLTDDMMDWVPGTMKNYSGATDFRESIIVNKRDGIYHFTWSQDDTGSENYQVNYGTSTSLYGPITYHYPILQKDTSKNILGTGHHSTLYIPERDEYYIAHHRFLTPLGQVSSGYGYHRETCLEKLEFGEDGLLKKATPTLEGITEPVYTAQTVINKIADIGIVMLESKDAIEDARAAYNALNDAQKDLVTNAEVLIKAEESYKKLEKEKADKDAAKKVQNMIAGIGTVTAGSGAAIEAAEKAYNALTKDQKALVNNYQVLKDAREAYKKLTENLNPPTEKTKVPANGSKHTKGKYVYKVTKSSAKNGTVQLVKPKSKNMTKAKIPATVKIKGYKFKVTSIASKAFKKNKKLKTVTIGQNVKTIGKQAFANCTKLNKIIVNSTGVKTVGANAFKGISPKAKIKVPAKKFKKYQKRFAGKGQKKTVKIIK